MESAWQLLEEQNEAIRENFGLGYFRRVNKNKSQHNNLVNYAKIKEIQQKRDQFFAELPKVRDRINNFLLNVIKLNPDLPIWQGRDKFLTKSNYRFVPNKYVASNFESNNHKGKISNGRTNGYGELDTGFEYYKSDWEEIKMQWNTDFENIIPNLTHEEYHKIFFGEQAMRNLIIGNENIQKQNQMTTFLMEGTVELLKQLNLEFDSIPDNKGYPNEIAFIKYLVANCFKIRIFQNFQRYDNVGGDGRHSTAFCSILQRNKNGNFTQWF